MVTWYAYNVYAGKKHIDFVKAFSEDDACKRVRKKWGPPEEWYPDSEYWAEWVPLGPILGRSDGKKSHK